MSRARLVLASGSPRRRELLEAAGFAPEVLESDLDDGRLRPGRVDPIHFVVASAWFKARRVLERYRLRGAIVLAADTVCLDGDRILGKPSDAADAAAMLRRLRGAVHRATTGVCVIDADGRRRLFSDAALVSMGPIDDDAIDSYVASGAWRGKAGGYNLAERIAEGWPIRCDGDPTSVMGLPMRRVVPLLVATGAARG
jgi:septum formation protein